MRHPALRVATWILMRLVPKEYRDALIGDLEEEHARRAEAVSSSAALKWYLRQIWKSIPPLLWASIMRGAWISTIGVALLAFFAVGFVDVAVKIAVSNWTTSDTMAPRVLGLFMLFPVVVLIGYFAERFRRRAAILLGAMMMLLIIGMVATAPASSPLWYRVAYFLVVPGAAFIGSVLPSLRRSRS